MTSLMISIMLGGFHLYNQKSDRTELSSATRLIVWFIAIGSIINKITTYQIKVFIQYQQLCSWQNFDRYECISVPASDIPENLCLNLKTLT